MEELTTGTEPSFRIGNYTIVEPLEDGPIANVFLVAKDNEHFSLKLIPTRSADARDLLMTAYVALQTKLASLEGSGAVPIVEVFSAEGNRVSVVSEYVEGQSLQFAPKPSPPQFVQLLFRLASTLEHAHTASMVHGNMRPENVLLPDNAPEHARVINFLVPGDQRSATSGELAIRAHYLSPEQMGGEPATAKSDIFSLGAIAYASITGHAPFEGESLVESLYKHLEWEAPALVDCGMQGFPSRLCKLVEGMLQHDPDDRISTMSEVARELEKIVGVLQ